MSTCSATLEVCAHCGLPLPGARRKGDETLVAERVFCCSGCRLADAVTGAEGATSANAALVRLGLGIFFTMNVMVFSMTMWSQDVYATQFDADDPMAAIVYQLFRYLALLCAAPVVVLLGEPVARGVRQSLSRGALTADLLILIGVASAFAYSVVSVTRGAGHVYFDAACMILLLLTLGRWLEATGKQRTNTSLDALAKLLPSEVRRLRQGRVECVERNQVALGDVLHVLPGERFGVDGNIVAGYADVDQQAVTGESAPVAKQIGDPIYSGSLNLNGDVRIETTAVAGADTLARLLEMVREARLGKGSYCRLADRLATWFVPVVCTLSVAAAAWHALHRGTDAGIMAGLSVALIACPCALGLAAPMAVWNAMGHAAANGVVIRSGAALEQLAQLEAICFDKTGTLTTGNVDVERVLLATGAPRGEFLRRAAAAASVSGHPFAAPIRRFAELELGDSGAGVPCRVSQVRTLTGKGMAMEIEQEGVVLYFGSAPYMREAGLQVDSQLEADWNAPQMRAASRICLGWEGWIRGVFVLCETLRPEARDAMAACRKLGLDVEVLTGDHPERGRQLAEELGSVVHSGLLPDDKVAALVALRQRRGAVAMVGDGVNDAPALAASDLGVALGCGADLSRDAADVCLLHDDLRRLPWAIELAQKTVRVIRQNLFWAFAYNLTGVALAAGGKLNPVWSAVAMAASSLIVLTNSLRLAKGGDLAYAASKDPFSREHA